MKKRLFAMLMSLVLTVSVLAGCGGNDEQTTTTSATEAKTTAADTTKATEVDTTEADTTAADTEENPWAHLDLSEHETVNVYVIGSLGTDWERITGIINEKMEEKVNTTVNFVYVPWSDAMAKYNLFVAGDEEIDVIYAAPWISFSDYARSGAFKEIDMDFVKTWMPLTYENQPAESWEASTIDGKIYGIPGGASSLSGFIGVVTTQELLDKYGFKAEDITDLDKLEEYLVAVKAGNEDGLIPVNSHNAIPMDNDILSYHTFNNDAGSITWMIYNYDYDKLDTGAEFDPDDLEWFATSDNYREFVLRMARWNIEGLFPSNVLTAETTMDDNFLAGKSAFNWGTPSTVSTLRRTMTSGTPVYLDCIFDDTSATIRGSYSGYCSCFPVNSTKTERTALVLDVLKFDEEVHMLLRGGIEGEHYTLNRETNFRALGPNADAYPWGSWMYWMANNGEPEIRLEDDLQAYQDVYNAAEVSPTNYPIGGFTFDGSDFEAELANLNALFNEYRTSFNFGVFGEDTEAKLDEFIAQCKQLRIDDIIEEYKAQVKEYLANK